MSHILGIDVGGTGIKAALVDTETGEFIKEKIKYGTPSPSTPANVSGVLNQLIDDFDYRGQKVGCGFPSIIKNSVVHSASNIDDSWLGVDLKEYFLNEVGSEGVFVNDADAAGIAEMKFGKGRDRNGTVLMLTLGTGIGSGLFIDGKLVPNTELGHLTYKNSVWEKYASNGARKKRDLSWEEWGKCLNKYINHVNFLFSPDLILLGGGVSKKFENFSEYIELKELVTPALMQNNAGIIGAAMSASEL